MANPTTPTDKHPYKSNAADFYVDAANYLAELICKKKHEDENTGALPRFFWRSDTFKNLYIREVSQAKNLLKKYDQKSIVQAMKSPKAKWIRSLRNKNLLPIIKEFEKTKEETEFCAVSQEFKVKRKQQFSTYKNPLKGL